MIIESQMVKVNPDGTKTIDIIIELPDVQEVNSYEVRVAKA